MEVSGRRIAILEIATVVLAAATFYLAWEARQSSYRQIGVETWLTLEARFDSREMKHARKDLAGKLSSASGRKAENVPEDVLDFFESVGTLYNHRPARIARDLAESSFSYYAVGWWESASEYVNKERGLKGDRTLWIEFEVFAKTLHKKYGPPPASEIREFLQGEQALIIE